MTTLEFDLDQLLLVDGGRPGSRPGPARRPRSTVALVVLLVAAAVGGALARTATGTPAEPRQAAVATRLTLRDLSLAPEPTMSVHLVVSATGGDLELDRLDLSGGGVSQTGQTVRRSLAAGEVVGVDWEVPFVCRPFGTPSLTGTLRVRDLAADVWRDVPVVMAGGLQVAGGACGLTRGTLPDGWQAPVAVEQAGVTGDVLRIQLADLGGERRVQGVFAGGTLLSPVRTNPGGGTGTRELALLPPTADCRALAREATVPAGLRVLVIGGPEGLVSRYAAVGPVLSAWLQRAYRRACPDRAPQLQP